MTVVPLETKYPQGGERQLINALLDTKVPTGGIPPQIGVVVINVATAAAVADAVRIRARPIYLSTLTSIFGMLPLMLVPGVGSQIYRGLATVIIGGMFVSALFTLILMPSVLRLPPLTNPLRRRFPPGLTDRSGRGTAGSAPGGRAR